MANFAAGTLASGAAAIQAAPVTRAQDSAPVNGGSGIGAASDPMFAALLAQMMSPQSAILPAQGVMPAFSGGSRQRVPALQFLEAQNESALPPALGTTAMRTTPAWLQQIMSAGVQKSGVPTPVFPILNGAGEHIDPSTPMPLPAFSATQSTTNTIAGQTLLPQTLRELPPSIQQIIAEKLQAGALSSPSGLPAGVPGYGQSTAAVQAAASPAANAMAPQSASVAPAPVFPVPNGAGEHLAPSTSMSLPAFPAAQNMTNTIAGQIPFPQTLQDLPLSTQQIIAQKLQAGALSSPRGLPSGVPSYAQSTTAEQAATIPVANTAAQSASAAPAPVFSAAQSTTNAIAGQTLFPQMLRELPLSIQQIIAEKLQTGGLSSPNILPSGVPSYAQSTAAAQAPTSPAPDTMAPQSVGAAPAWLQQIIAANLQTSPFLSAANVPAGATASPQAYNMSVAPGGVVSPQNQVVAQRVFAPVANTILAPSANALSQASASALRVPAANAPQPSPLQTLQQIWLAHVQASSPSLSAANTGAAAQAIAAVPAISNAAQPPLYPSPGHANQTPGLQSGANSYVPSSTGPLATLIQNLRTGIVVPTFKPQAPASLSPPASTAASGVQQSQPAPANGSAASAQSAPVTNDEISMAMAAQNAIHQAASTSVTQTQSLPLNFEIGGGKSGSSGNGSGPQITAEDTLQGRDNDTAPGAGNSGQVPAAGQTDHSGAAQISAPVVAAATNAPTPTPANLNSAASAMAIAQSPNAAQTVSARDAATAQPAVQSAAPDVSALAISIAAKSVAGAQQFDIRLDPAELGRVQVHLSLDASGTAQAHLAADKPETLALLQNNSSSLARALQDSGVQLASNGLQFSLRGQNQQGNGSQRGPAGNRLPGIEGTGAAEPAGSALSNYGHPRSPAGINIIV